MTFVSYYDYIKSDQWYQLTAPIRQRNGGICEVCQMRYGDSIHHRTYIRLGAEDADDLLHVCNPCHRLIHHKKGAGYIWQSRLEFVKQLQIEISGEQEIDL